MSNEVDNQIVSMQFDNKQFESGVATSLGTIDKLKSSLSFSGAGQGLGEIDRAVKGFSLNPISAGIQGVNKAWLGMTTIAVTAIGTITNKAVDAGLRMGKALTLDPIKAGFQNYETKINAVQTILSNTADQGTKLKDVTSTLNDLNNYANLTVYNFSEMAKNIGTFTAAGVDLKTSTESIKGIANLAALSGSTSEQASSAMYQLSQAIAAGQVHLQDWNSVVNAGIGGAAFQKNLIQTAIATGSLDKSQVHLGKTMADTTINGVAFRQSLTPPPGGTSWLTSKTLTTSLGTFTGDLSKAQLVAKGFAPEVAKAIAAQGEMARNAATQVKTFSQLFQALKEEVGSAYAKIFEALFGNINDAKKFLSPLHQTLENALTKPILAVADALASWRKAGGFNDILAIFKNLSIVVSNLLTPFKKLFAPLFPSTKAAGKGLEGFTKTLATLTGWLVKITNPIGKFNIHLGFMGKLFKMVSSLVGAFFKALQPLVPVFNQLSKYVGGLFNQGMEMAGNLIAGWIQGLDVAKLQKAVVDMANSIVVWIKDTLGIHSPAATMIPIGLNIIQGIVSGLAKGASYLISGLQKVFIGLGKTVKYMSQNISWSDVLDSINTGLFLGVVLLFRNFVKAFGGTMNAFRELMDKGGGVLDQITSNLKTMQQKVKSEIIRNIAISVALLAGSALLLSTIDAKKLGLAIGAIAGLMTSLVASMAIMTHGSGKGSVKDSLKQMAVLNSLSKSLIAFSSAVLILTAAVAIMGQLDPKTIKKGLAGVAGVISIIVAATAILSKTGGGATILATATAMLIMSAALTAFVGVMKLYEKLDWKTLIRGGGAAAAVIVAVGLAMRAFGKGSLSGSVGMIAAAIALRIMAKALVELSALKWDNLKHATEVLAILLVVMGLTSKAFTPVAAASMFVMAAAIIVLAKSLEILSNIPGGDLVKAIVGLAAALVVLAVTTAALSGLSGFITAFGLALLTVGGAIFLAGAGILAFATAMGILAVVGPAAFQAVSDGIDQLVDKLPEIGQALGEMVVSFFTGLVAAAQPLAKAIGKLLGILLDELGKLVPKMQNLIQKVINATLEVIVHSYGHAAKVILGFIMKMLNVLDKNVPKFITRGTDLIVAIITGLGKNGVRIANATGKAILDFLRGLDKAINKYEKPIIAEGLTIGKDLVKGLIQGMKDGLPDISKAASGLAHKALDVIKSPSHWHINSPSRTARKLGAGFSEGAALGIGDNANLVEKSAGAAAKNAMAAMKMTFRNSKNAADGLIDTQPKITPVLDLSQLARDASRIGSTIGTHKISADITRNKAHNIASDHAASHKTHGEAMGDTYEFIQNLYSPKPVNHVAAYRGTKSQISLFREVTGK